MRCFSISNNKTVRILLIKKLQELIMSTFTHKSLFAALLTALTLNSSVLFAAGNGTGGPANAQTNTCPVVNPEIRPGDEEVIALLFLREEEKLAHDVYQTFAAQWQSNIFANIALSEQKHMQQIACLLDAYALPDPMQAEMGRFTNPDLQAWYDDLIARGSASLVAALQVGALIEETDVADLRQAIDASQISDVQSVYGSLLRASQNHLQSFVSTLEQQGQSYAPQNPELVNALVTPPAVFNLDDLSLHIPVLRLMRSGQLLGATDTYRAELRMRGDNNSMELHDLQHIPQVQEMDGMPPLAFDLDTLQIEIPGLRLMSGGQLLAAEETYRARLRMEVDGRTFQVEEVQRGRAPN
jgi:hypothetical protein